MINTPGELRAYMELLSTEHKLIKDFFYGDYEDILEAERSTIEYPCLWLEDMEINPQGEDSLVIIYDFSFVILANSRVDDKDRKMYNQESTFRIANDILSRINKDAEDDKLDFEIAQAVLDPINTIGNDDDQGWRVSVKIESKYSLCYNADIWHNNFPQAAIPRFKYINDGNGHIVCENESEPDGWTVAWKTIRDGVEGSDTGDTISIDDGFNSLYIEMSITMDSTNYLRASAYLTSAQSGLSVPFIYNPTI